MSSYKLIYKKILEEKKRILHVTNEDYPYIILDGGLKPYIHSKHYYLLKCTIKGIIIEKDYIFCADIGQFGKQNIDYILIDIGKK